LATFAGAFLAAFLAVFFAAPFFVNAGFSASFAAWNAAQRFFVASAMARLPAALSLRFLRKGYSQAATTFRHFKDAWRNHVAHSRDSYDDEQARRIFDNVVAFMRDATALPALP
jgi:hypothetical protein